MPIDMMIDFLRSRKKSLYDKIFEVYIGLIVGEAEQVIVKKENLIYMDYNYFLQYLLDYREQSKGSWMASRSVVLFFTYNDTLGIPTTQNHPRFPIFY